VDAQESFDAGQPFTRAAALTAGLTPAALRGPGFRRLGHGVYVDAAAATTALAAARAVLLGYGGRAHASHATAARIHDLPIPVLADEHVTVATASHRKDRRGARVHVGRNAEVVRIEGVRVSSGRQTFLDLAGVLGLVDLVVVGDALVRAGLTTPDGLSAFCAASAHRAAARAGRAAALVRERVDSPMETRLRLLLVFSGLPEPEVNRTIRADNGDPLRRYDLSWTSVKVIVEYDGRQHIERIDQWESDLDRREAIDDEGWRILVVTSRGIYRDPGSTVERVWRVLRARGLSGLAARPSGAWRAHFPGHS
jgi:very-short-patch-repair endonuclease